MNIIKLSATDSTNTYLSDLTKNSFLEDETIVVTNRQQKGRGQRDARWQSQSSKSLTCSMFKRLEGVELQQQFMISMVVSIAIVRYLQSILSADIQIKWPNDIMAEGKKCGGILIENQVRGSAIKATIVGFGLNVNEDSFSNLPQATSLYLTEGKIFNLDELLIGVTSEIFAALNHVKANPRAAVISNYEQLLFKKGVLSTYKLPDGTLVKGVISGVNVSGQLLLNLPDGKSIKFWNKEIEMVF